MTLYSSLSSLLPIDGWKNITDGFSVHLLLFKDASLNEISWLLCVYKLLKKKTKKSKLKNKSWHWSSNQLIKFLLERRSSTDIVLFFWYSVTVLCPFTNTEPLSKLNNKSLTPFLIFFIVRVFHIMEVLSNQSESFSKKKKKKIKWITWIKNNPEIRNCWFFVC